MGRVGRRGRTGTCTFIKYGDFHKDTDYGAYDRFRERLTDDDYARIHDNNDKIDEMITNITTASSKAARFM
jgi:hypothetical protein